MRFLVPVLAAIGFLVALSGLAAGVITFDRFPLDDFAINGRASGDAEATVPVVTVDKAPYMPPRNVTISVGVSGPHQWGGPVSGTWVWGVARYDFANETFVPVKMESYPFTVQPGTASGFSPVLLLDAGSYVVWNEIFSDNDKWELNNLKMTSFAVS